MALYDCLKVAVERRSINAIDMIFVRSVKRVILPVVLPEKSPLNSSTPWTEEQRPRKLLMIYRTVE
jgi:hypothetical protein